MSLRIPAGLKKEFKDGFAEFIKTLGRPVSAYLEPYSVDCPNCIADLVQKKSSNKYNISFKSPLNIFPGTSIERKVYPIPFNVLTVSGVQYNPALPNPKILQASVCPVCKGKGNLEEENVVCFQALVTRGLPKKGVYGPDTLDLSAGRDGVDLVRIKTYSCNYSVVRDAKYFIIDGIKAKLEDPPRLKGLGQDAIVEGYMTYIQEDQSSSIVYDGDSRINNNTIGTQSNQASTITPTIPPHVDGDDVW